MKFKSNSYHIIASIEDERYIKGIFDDTIKKRCDQKGLECFYYSLENSAVFYSTIEQIKSHTFNLSNFPHIHIECHGSHDGIQLKNGEKIVWEDLEMNFKEINGLSKNYLVVTMASCFGGHFSLSLLNNIRFEENSRAPFYALIGPENPISYGELEDGFSSFFDSILTQEDLTFAVESLRINSKHEGKFIYMTCESIFKDAVDFFIKSSVNELYENEDILEARVKSIINMFEELNGVKALEHQYESTRISLKSINLNEKILKRLRVQYFWIDKYPENNSRFIDFTLNECFE